MGPRRCGRVRDEVRARRNVHEYSRAVLPRTRCVPGTTDVVFRTLFKGTTLALRIAALRFIRPDVAIADIDATLRGFSTLPPGMSAMRDGSFRSKLLMALVKEQGDWWITAYHNVGVAPTDRTGGD